MKNSVKVLLMFSRRKVICQYVEQQFNTKYQIHIVLSRIKCLLVVFLKENNLQKNNQ